MFREGDYVWHRERRDSIWKIQKIRARGSQYPRSPEDVIVRMVARLDPSKVWIGSKTRVVSPVYLEHVPEMLAVAAMAADTEA